MLDRDELGILTKTVDGPTEQPIAAEIWRSKYQYKTDNRQIDRTLEDTWLRVANSLSQPEPSADRKEAARSFYTAMEGHKLLPGGRILAGAGTHRNVTLCNTFVMRTIPDSIEGIMDTIKDAALTMQMSGGIGFDFSTLRPKGMPVRGQDSVAAGPLAAMDICDAVCKLLVAGSRRGAMMGALRCDHPDIEAFVTVKSEPGRLRNFNLSVLVTDEFMAAVEAGADWQLSWDGQNLRKVNARQLWEQIMRQAYNTAEPGVLFIDRINRANPLGYLEAISATNSCAEQPLPPNGTCPLASINLTRLIKDPFGPAAELDKKALRDLTRVAVRMLDNVLDVTRFAIEPQRREARAKRRIGIGVTGVGDALILLGVRYGTSVAAKMLGSWLRIIRSTAYLASAELAAQRGSFPAYDATRHLAHPSMATLDPETKAAIARHGLRNGTLTTIAPTGTTSLFSGNVSSGIEPVFAHSFRRTIVSADGSKAEELVEDYAVRLYRHKFGNAAPLTPAFVTTRDLSPDDHIRMQAASQPWIDSGISKTVNCAENTPFSVFEMIYLNAYEKGCKGCTAYRPNSALESVLTV